LPAGVNASANITNTLDWLDPLRGYAYDSVNADTLLRLAEVKDGRVTIPNGASYQMLVLPLARPIAQHPELMTPELAQKLGELVQAGATAVACVHGRGSPSFSNYPDADAELAAIMGEPSAEGTHIRESPGMVRIIDSGRLIYGPIKSESFSSYGVEPDFKCLSTDGKQLDDIAWNHRRCESADWYFISNQAEPRDVVASFRVTGKRPEIWDPVTGEISPVKTWTIIHGRTVVPLKLAASSSLFVVFRDAVEVTGEKSGVNWLETEDLAELMGPWSVRFPQPIGSVEFEQLTGWSKHKIANIQHFSGTAVYHREFEWDGSQERVWLDLGEVANVAEVRVNKTACGFAWTPPYRVEITEALRPGKNELEIEVTNTWANRLIGDAELPKDKRQTWTTAPYPSADTKLLPAGLLGPVKLVGKRRD
jgi:hypothetical protein